MPQSAADQTKTMALYLLKPYPNPIASQVRQAVRTAAEAVRAMSGAADGIDEEAVAKEIESLLVIWSPDGTELVDKTGHVAWLPDKRSSIKWDFWHRYELYLEQEKGLPQAIISRLDSLSDRILENLEDPKRRGAWDRRGMVVGQVQSGKTANYTGLICKAVDAGYKLVVILAGTHNSLRSQTQLRLDEGFLGRDTQQSRAYTKESGKMGVGLLAAGGDPPAHSLTTSAENGDFKKSQAGGIAVHIGSDPVILVVKKNGAVLKNLLQWVRTTKGVRDEEGQWKIRNLPLLLLDDEADSASVSTNELMKDEDGGFKDVQRLTAINRRIREILHTFEQSAYVGYTATPFANIFIHPDAATKAEGEDLFPRSFIINLPAPSNYIGPAQVFGTDAFPSAGIGAMPGLPIVRTVDDFESLIPSAHKPDLAPPNLPESLREAIRAFVLSCAARLARGQAKAHNSMLIHVTRYNAVQQIVGELVEQEMRVLRRRLDYGDGERAPRLLDELRELWERDYEPTAAAMRQRIDDLGLTPLSWSDVEPCLREASLKIGVKLINGKAGDVLNYIDHPNGLSVVAIGGDKLSRGLTLEGLTVSYYLRASRMYDTLMQMGRWFGYRPGYADLCRLYTSQELVDWYEHITVASEELRQEFDRMAEARMTPRDYGLKVQTHPGGLMVTSAGKMRYSHKVRVSFANQLVESYLLKKDSRAIEGNFRAAGSLVRECQRRSPQPIRPGDCVWRGVPGDEVVEFLNTMEGHSGHPIGDPKKLAEYVQKKMQHGELVEWTVVLDSRSGAAGNSVEIGGIPGIGLTLRTPPKPKDGMPSADTYRIRNRHIISEGDELIDLTDAERQEAQRLARRDAEEKQLPSIPETPAGRFARQARPKRRGLLLLYPLDPKADYLFEEGDPRRDGSPIIGFAVSFPGTSRPDETVEYLANTVYWGATWRRSRMTENLEQVFRELEERPAAGAGVLERRLLSQSASDLFVGVQKPSNLRTFRARFSAAAVPSAGELPKFRGLEVQRATTQEDGGDYITIRLRLLGTAFNDVFTSLVDDVERTVAPISSEREAARAFVDRLVKWQHFMEYLSPEGLGPEQQRGLYGELWFLCQYVLPHLPPLQAVQSWTGPERTAKDFQFPRGAVEVKTTTAQQPQSMQINGEKQLDNLGLGVLYLCHLSLESARGSGQTLPEIVAQARALAAAEYAAQRALEDRLHEAGYFDAHDDRYGGTGHILRASHLFHVRDGFPRLTERDLPTGVGGVRYSLSVAACRAFDAAPGAVVALVKGED